MKSDITLSSIIEGLLVIGFAALLVYLIVYSKMMVQTMMKEETEERNAINVLNVLISHEKLVYEKDGIRYRGILSASKLDSLFYKSTTGLKDENEFKDVLFNLGERKGKLTKEELDVGYDQLIGIIYIVDLDSCNKQQCIVWTGVLLPVLSWNDLKQDNPIYKFFNCLYQSFDGNWLRPTATCAGFAATGGSVGFFVGGPIGAAIGTGVGCLAGFLSNMFSAAEIQQCVSKASMDVKNFYISETITKKQGLPINIIYEDGTIHSGRIIGGFVRWY